MEEKEQLNNQTNPREIAKQYGINERILTIIDNGSLENWNGIRNLPNQIIRSFGITDPGQQKIMIVGNIIAATAKSMIDLIPNNEKVISVESLSETEREKILMAAILFYSYPKGIEPTNPAIALQVEAKKIKDLERSCTGLVPKGSSLTKELEKMGFNLIEGNYSLPTTRERLENWVTKL